MIVLMIKTSLKLVKKKLSSGIGIRVTNTMIADALGMRRAKLSEFANGKPTRVHLDFVNAIIEWAKSQNVELSISDFFVDDDSQNL